MSVHGYAASHRRFVRGCLLGSSALLALSGLGETARSQVALPQLTVTAAKNRPKPKPRAAPRPAPRAAAAVPVTPLTPAQQLEAKSNGFDQARSSLYTTIGTTSDTISHDTIQALPQGTNAPVEKVLLQAPGVSQDSAASGLIHVRNDHANVQFRINGVMLPDGVTGFGSVLDTSLIGSISLITGALPAEYGLRTVGLVDITTRADIFNNSGSVSLYGGSRGTFQPSFEYGGTFGGNCPSTSAPLVSKAAPIFAATECFPGVQYFFTGRYLQTTEGIENPTPSLNAIHDFSQQERGFGYMSTFVDPYTRLSLIVGTSTSTFQIPNVPGQPVGQIGNPPVTDAFGMTTFDSSKLNENQFEDTQFGVLALQRSVNGFDGQLSYFTRYNYLHFTPDPVGDLLLNGIASDISREALTNGIQGDASYVINPAHTLRAGFTVSGEQTNVDNSSLVEPCVICDGTDNGPPETITDNVAKLGWLAGVYAQDEWKVTNNFTINGGLRFDQMWQYVDANQLSPRLSFTYKPFENTTFHAGYARYFTPPVLVEAAPANIALFNNTTGAPPAGQANSPVLPERSHYFDAGVDQKIPLGCYSSAAKDCTTLELGVDAYYKIASDSDRQRQFRPGAGAQRLQLRQRHQRRRRIQREIPQRQFPGLRQPRRRPGESHPGGVEPISVRQHHAACRSRRLDRVSVHPDTLDLHRSQPDRDRLGRRVLSLERHAVLHRHDLRLWAAHRRRQHRQRSALRAIQCRHLARIRRARRQAAHGALRRRQPVRHDLSDQKRHRHRRVRAAIRPAPRLFRRRVEENLIWPLRITMKTEGAGNGAKRRWPEGKKGREAAAVRAIGTADAVVAAGLRRRRCHSAVAVGSGESRRAGRVFPRGRREPG